MSKLGRGDEFDVEELTTKFGLSLQQVSKLLRVASFNGLLVNISNQ